MHSGTEYGRSRNCLVPLTLINTQPCFCGNKLLSCQRTLEKLFFLYIYQLSASLKDFTVLFPHFGVLVLALYRIFRTVRRT